MLFCYHKLFLHILQLKKHWVEYHEKNGWTEGVALKDSPTEWKGLGAPGLGLHHGPAVGVEAGHVGADVVRDMVPFEGLHDEGVGNTPKGVLEVEEGNVGCLLVLPGMLDHLLHGHVVLNAPIDAGQEGLLYRRVHQIILEEEGGEALVEKEVESFPNATTECYHSEIRRV